MQKENKKAQARKALSDELLEVEHSFQQLTFVADWFFNDIIEVMPDEVLQKYGVVWDHVVLAKKAVSRLIGLEGSEELPDPEDAADIVQQID